MNTATDNTATDDASTTDDGAPEVPMLNTRQAAQRLGVHHSRVLQLIHQGRIRASKFTTHWKIHPNELERPEVRFRPTGRPTREGSRVRTDRINRRYLQPGDDPLKPQDRAEIKRSVQQAVDDRSATWPELPYGEKLAIGERAVSHKNWSPETRRCIVDLVLFGNV